MEITLTGCSRGGESDSDRMEITVHRVGGGQGKQEENSAFPFYILANGCCCTTVASLLLLRCCWLGKYELPPPTSGETGAVAFRGRGVLFIDGESLRRKGGRDIDVDTYGENVTEEEKHARSELLVPCEEALKDSCWVTIVGKFFGCQGRY